MAKTFSKSFNIHRPIFHFLLIVLFILISYSNTLTVPFVFDDGPNIEANPIIKDFRHYSDPSSTEVYSNLDVYPMYKNGIVGSLSFALNYRVNGLNVAGYHAVNIFYSYNQCIACLSSCYTQL